MSPCTAKMAVSRLSSTPTRHAADTLIRCRDCLDIVTHNARLSEVLSDFIYFSSLVVITCSANVHTLCQNSTLKKSCDILINIYSSEARRIDPIIYCNAWLDIVTLIARLSNILLAFINFLSIVVITCSTNFFTVCQNSTMK